MMPPHMQHELLTIRLVAASQERFEEHATSAYEQVTALADVIEEYIAVGARYGLTPEGFTRWLEEVATPVSAIAVIAA